MSKTQFRKDMNKELRDKLLLKDASLLQIVSFLIRKLIKALRGLYGRHEAGFWELFAGIGWALFVLKYIGVL